MELPGRVITPRKIHFLDVLCLTGMPSARKLSMPHHWRHLNTAWERLSTALPLPLAFMCPRALCKYTLFDLDLDHGAPDGCFTNGSQTLKNNLAKTYNTLEIRYGFWPQTGCVTVPGARQRSWWLGNGFLTACDLIFQSKSWKIYYRAIQSVT